jgi:hypothetical protein
MKNKLRKLIFIAALATISVFTFFQPYDTGSGKTDTLRLCTIAQAAIKNGVEEGKPSATCILFDFKI